MMTMGEPCADEQSSWWDAVQGIGGAQQPYDSQSEQDQDVFGGDFFSCSGENRSVNARFHAADVLGMIDTHPLVSTLCAPRQTPVPTGSSLNVFRRYMKKTYAVEREEQWELYDAYTERLEATLPPVMERLDDQLKRGRDVELFISFDEWKSATATELKLYQVYILEERRPNDVREFSAWQSKY